MKPKQEVIKEEKECLNFFNTLEGKEVEDPKTIKDLQFKDSLFKYSGACAGCGETPHLSLLTKLVGDRAVIANATGCSSIYGGNLPTTPYGKNKEGRGPAWSNSLFEDAAEFGLGFKDGYLKGSQVMDEILWNEEEGRWITLKVSTSGMKTINKKGLAVALKEAAAPKKVY